MGNRGTLGSFSKLALASGLALLAACNGDYVFGEGGERSFAGSDICNPDCAGRVCGDDGCGGSCGDCTGADLCNGQGTCFDPANCTPDCADRECGDDGCGGDCAPNSCTVDETCNATGQCVANPVSPVTNRSSPAANGDPPVVSGDPPDGLFLDGFFPIGDFIIYPPDVDERVARGINTAFGIGNYSGAFTDQEWDDAMAAAGLKVVRKPLGDLATDAAKPHLLAWEHRDEPDIGTGSPPYYDETLVHTTIPNDYATWKAAAPDQEVFVNLAGIDVESGGPYGCNGPGDIPSRESPPQGRLDCYPTLIAAADWIGNDFYPIGFNNLYGNGDIRQAGWILDKFNGIPNGFNPNWSDDWVNGKPLFGFIENNFFDSNTGTRGATPAEMRAEIWHLIIHGARGYVYFGVRVGPPGFSWDNVDAAHRAEMIRTNRQVTALAYVLQDVINPVSVRATMSAAQLEAGWRDTPSGKYFFVLNTQATPVTGATITLTGIGAETSATVYGESRTEAITDGNITDDFGEFELHIYRVAP